MTNFIKLTYYHTMYQKDVTVIVDKIKFDEDGYARFAHMGHKEAVEIKYIRKVIGMEE